MPLVIDSSAAINVTASGFAPEILSALPNDIIAVDTIAGELDVGRQRGRPHADLFDALVASGHIKIVNLDGAAEAHFESLVIGTAANTLDDGEAATIAYAVAALAMPIVDERKAIRICQERFPKVGIGCTSDLFAHPYVEEALGRRRLAGAVLMVLQEARMRVLPHHVDWVVDLIGPERASSCSSLSLRTRKRIGSARV